MTPLLVPGAVAIAAEFLPVLATKLGGERGRMIAGKVIETAAKIAGTPKGADIREIIAALNTDEGKATELRLRLEELDQEEHQRIIDDRVDARAYQLATGSGGRFRGTMMLLGVVAGLVSCIVAVFRSTTDPAALALLTTIAGALLKMLSDAFAFEFGSSAGSKEKDAQIEKFQKALIDKAQARSEAVTDAPRASILSMPEQWAAKSTTPEELPKEAEICVTITTRDFVTELVTLAA